MAVVVRMPKLSDTMEEGGIAAWLKKEGDAVEEGEPLIEIETDKATMEYASPEEGTLLKIIVQPGASAALQAPIAIFGESGESIDLEQLLAEESSATADVGEQPVESAPKQDPEAAPQIVAATTSSRIKASPLAKKLAAEYQLDLTLVQGSGPAGRIIKQDVEAAHSIGHASSGDAIATSQVQIKSDRSPERIPISMMRKTIAKRLLAGKNNAPHFYLTTSANMEDTLSWRAQLNQDRRVLDGALPKISVNDLIMLACSRAVKSHLLINSSWQDDHILQHQAVHMSMAVATKTGLITPVLFDCDLMGVWDIARLSKDLATRAKEGTLDPSQYTGGTFTVSNLGMTVVDEFTAIINPPQACILAVGRTQAVPYVSESGQLTVQKRMKVTLSCDHRVVDGLVGAKFLETLVQYLESPLMMLT